MSKISSARARGGLIRLFVAMAVVLSAQVGVSLANGPRLLLLGLVLVQATLAMRYLLKLQDEVRWLRWGLGLVLFFTLAMILLPWASMLDQFELDSEVAGPVDAAESVESVAGDGGEHD